MEYATEICLTFRKAVVSSISIFPELPTQHRLPWLLGVGIVSWSDVGAAFALIWEYASPRDKLTENADKLICRKRSYFVHGWKGPRPRIAYNSLRTLSRVYPEINSASEGPPTRSNLVHRSAADQSMTFPPSHLPSQSSVMGVPPSAWQFDE